MSVESSIENAAKMLDGDLVQQKAKILQLLVEVITSMPEKCSVYSTLVGLLNAKHYNFCGEVRMVLYIFVSITNCGLAS